MVASTKYDSLANNAPATVYESGVWAAPVPLNDQSGESTTESSYCHQSYRSVPDADIPRILSDMGMARLVYQRCHTMVPLRAEAKLAKYTLTHVSLRFHSPMTYIHYSNFLPSLIQ